MIIHMRAIGPACLAVFIAGCTIDDLQHEKRYCSTEYPCAEGYECQQNMCIKQGGPDGPNTDGPVPELGLVDRAVSDQPPPPDKNPDKNPDMPLMLEGPLPDIPTSDGLCGTGLTYCGGTCVDVSIDKNHCGNCFFPCNPGTSDTCVNGQCRCGSGQSCGNGLTCVSGLCECVVGPASLCAGCCENNICTTGDTIAACGTGGIACTACQGGPCQQVTCSAGACGTQSEPNGTPCTTPSPGFCRNGGCCDGCWDATVPTCYSGNTNDHCGDNGANCTNCTATGMTCNAGLCI